MVRKGTWEVLPVFRMLAEKGGVAEAELYRVFNMGVGMVAIVAADHADAVLRFIRARGTKAWPVGEVVKGAGRARVV
jgi:phosphoribosylformylglycinamidine cyclo-ligase